MNRVTQQSAVDRYIESSRGDLEGLRTHLKIDKNDLDSELVHQPDFYFQVSEAYAEVVSKRDQAKYDRDKQAAESDRLVRQEARNNDEKITDSQAGNRVKEDPNYDECCRNYLKLCYLCGLWQGLKDSYEERNYALSKVADLYIAGYFSSSSAGRERSNAVDRKANSVRSRTEEMRNEQLDKGRQRQ